MNSYEYLLKSANEQLGYAAQPPTSTGTRSGGPGAPALPPAPSVAPTTFAPPPSPSPKVGGLLDDIETALRRRRLMRAAQDAALASAAPAAERYRAARNKALKSVGLHGLGLGLGGLALYGAGRYLMNRAAPSAPAHQPSSEDFAGSYGG